MLTKAQWKDKKMESLTLSELKTFCDTFDLGVLAFLPHKAVMHSRNSRGGTAPAAVFKQIEMAKAILKKHLLYFV